MTILRPDDDLSKIKMSTELYDYFRKQGITTVAGVLWWRKKPLTVRDAGIVWDELMTLVNGLNYGSHPEYIYDEYSCSTEEDPCDEFHVWIRESKQFVRASTYINGALVDNYIPRSEYLDYRNSVQIVWCTHTDACYPVMIECANDGLISFLPINPGAKRRHKRESCTQEIDTYVIHNLSSSPLNVLGLEPILPWTTIKFNATDYCGKHLNGYSVIGRGIVIATTNKNVNEAFLEKTGTVEKLTDEIWHFYTDAGQGGFRNAEFLLSDVEQCSLKGSLLTLRGTSITDKTNWVIRILLEDDQ